MNRRAFLALPFVAPIATVIAKATPAPKPSHICWACNKPVYSDRMRYFQTGGPGYGKTAMTAELIAEAVRDGHVVFAGYPRFLGE